MSNLAIKIIMGLIKGILGMKFGWLLLIVVASVIGISLVKNIFSGSFNIAKFAGGFNIFTGSVQGKLIIMVYWLFWRLDCIIN